MKKIVKERGKSRKTTSQTIKNDLDLNGLLLDIIYDWTL